MRFEKWHGIGNDFVMLADPDDRVTLTPETVKALCDRRFGIGADGVIRVAPGPDGTHLFMDYVNSDGSVGEMCGNGIRCLALFARAHRLAASDELKVATRAGVRTVWIEGDRVRVDMGAPIFEPALIPVRWDEPDALHAKIELDDQTIESTILSVGNPHAVMFVEDPEQIDVPTLGRKIETNAIFPNGTNAEFVTVESPARVRMRVWERGSGETLACGTGAAAVAVASRLLGGVGSKVTVALPGGELEVEWAGSLTDEQPIFMAGPAVEAFSGEVDLQDYR
jgi:diaminopimelate epimerase